MEQQVVSGRQFEDVLAVLNQKHVLSILANLAKRSPQRFTQLQDYPVVLTPKLLSRRLEDLVRIGLVARQAYRESPPRVEYELTAMGQDVLPVYQALYDWHLRHDGLPVICNEASAQ